ncbi:peptidyl-prolyl cis-trans isomerase, partial [Rhizobium ruizarguesonis]
KQRYRAPEYRKLVYLKLQPADIAYSATVTDDQIHEAFDKSKDTYRTPESRTIEQLTFASKDLALVGNQLVEAGAALQRRFGGGGKILAG